MCLAYIMNQLLIADLQVRTTLPVTYLRKLYKESPSRCELNCQPAGRFGITNYSTSIQIDTAWDVPVDQALSNVIRSVVEGGMLWYTAEDEDCKGYLWKIFSKFEQPVRSILVFPELKSYHILK